MKLHAALLQAAWGHGALSGATGAVGCGRSRKPLVQARNAKRFEATLSNKEVLSQDSETNSETNSQIVNIKALLD